MTAAHTSAIGRIFPDPSDEASDEELLDWNGPPRADHPWVSFNFVSSLDGAASIQGRSGGLGSVADQRLFALLRRQADVILVGAQTVRAEGYSGELIDTQARQWRLDRDRAARPAFAIVSGSLALDAGAEVFTSAPVRPLILTVASAPASRRRALARVADVVDCGAGSLDLHAAVAALRQRDLNRIHCEGGPHLFGAFQSAGLVDELCLTLSPLLVGGDAPRIAADTGGPAGQGAAGSTPLNMELVHVLASGSQLFLRYVAAR